ncbi:hypothetical protein GEO21_12820 [Sphingobacterium faecium]|uniref:hypothetical protein n=1 Tax=Sphingobacterium faecium TaxID=34087 RepID=UPI0012917726|nr:hypothetical protein [Sphingobacterium faecium]MQP28392.1 hypothetical protein [Sphingobacterium faecium]
MELLSPRNIIMPDIAIIASVQRDFDYIDPIFSTKMKKSTTSIALGGNGSSIHFPSEPTNDQLVEFAGMQSLIKSCVDNAEEIKDRIHRIIFNKVKPESEEERIRQVKMDFMTVKQWFMDDIRSSKIYQKFSKYNSTKKLKPFSQAFNTFILDRNKYTHGQLCFNYPQHDYLLVYTQTPEQRQRYAHIDIPILTSYNQFYKEIRDVISEYSIIHQER